MKGFRTPWQAAPALIAVFGFCVSLAQAADTPAPKIEFSEQFHNFGKSMPNQELKHSFTFKNTGSALLIIESVKSG
ncbi:MAG: DUF1573 domain-containing protein [Deltaproteobacteria bacterium]|nr:DUF1573 domain-containing protein [Deltaproteobacteria bacterium]